MKEIISVDVGWADGHAAQTDGLLGDDELHSGAEQRSLVVQPSEHGERLDKWLAQALGEFSRAYFQQLLASGGVQLNGQAVSKPATRLKVGDVVGVELRPTEQATAFVAEPMALSVLFEDEHLMVIDKPAGLVVHPAAGHWRGTLLNGLLAYHEQAARLARAGIVHRLDKDTSGLMLVGKSTRAVEALVRQIAAREVQRTYLALAHGPWRHAAASVWVDRPLGRDPRNRLRMAVHPAQSLSAKPAQTQVLRLDAHADALLLACKLHTGRTHQIRVHAAWLGCPLLGDAVYGGRALYGMQRQALHAHRLRVHHPISGDELTFSCPPPPDWAGALQQAGLHYNQAAFDAWLASADSAPPSASPDRVRGLRDDFS